MRARRWLLAMVPAACVLFAIGCSSSGGSDDSSPTAASATADTSTTVGVDALTVGQQYVEALAAEGGPNAASMAALASPDSVADLYARHTGTLAAVHEGAGVEPDAITVTPHEDSITVNFQAAGADEGVDTEWADFTLDDQGRLESFTINGTSLDGRLIVDGDSGAANGVTAKVASAFELITNDSPVVVVEFDNATARPYRLRRAVYDAPDGTRVTSVPDGQALVVAGGAHARVVLVFDTAPFGGTLTLQGTLAGAPLRQELSLAP